jgi:GDPmannose 4,6-dehydratase
VEDLIADASRAKNDLGWAPKVSFDRLIQVMIDADMRAAGLKPVGEGDKFLKKAFPERWWRID